MQRQIDTLSRSLTEHIAQPDYPTLVLDGTDSALVLPTRTLASFDRQDEENYYLLFPQPCSDAKAYLGAVIESLRLQLEILSAELSARSLPPVPPLPLEATDARQPPARRLESAIIHLGTHLPGHSTIAWGFLPSPLADITGYAALVRPLLLPAAVPAWMDRHRFFVRDQQAAPTIVPALLAEKNDRVLVLDVALDNARVLGRLVESAGDPSLPTDERMLAFYQLAAVDFSYKRYPEALEKYGAMFNYYAGTGNHAMQALCMLGAGDTLRQQGDAEGALGRYQQAVACASVDPNVPALQAGCYGAGTCQLTLGNDADAEGYLANANILAGKLNNPYAKCDAMEKLGTARYRQNRLEDAVDTWLKGKDLAKQFGYEERARAILEHLILACERAGLHAQRSGFERELSSLGGGAAPNAPHGAELASV